MILLGAKVVFRTDNLVLLGGMVQDDDDELYRIAIWGREDIADRTVRRTKSGGFGEKQDIGVDHMAFTFPDIDTQFVSYTRCKAAGILPSWTTNHGATLSMYYLDPDGTQVECQVDSMPRFDASGKKVGAIDWDRAVEFLTGVDFEANPIGVDFDADEIVEGYTSNKLTATDIFPRPENGPKELAMGQTLASGEAMLARLELLPPFVRAVLLGDPDPNEGQFHVARPTPLTRASSSSSGSSGSGSGSGSGSVGSTSTSGGSAMFEKFVHFVLVTRQVPESTSWYRTVFHTQSIFSKHGLINFMTYDDEHHRFGISGGPNVVPRELDSAGVSHFTYRYDTLDSLRHTHARLAALNASDETETEEPEPEWVRKAPRWGPITPFLATRGGPFTSLYYHDPDRNVVELSHRDPAAGNADVLAYFEGLAAFPGGYPFDPAVDVW
jgi:catechol-2,3-dioxygenase